MIWYPSKATDLGAQHEGTVHLGVGAWDSSFIIASVGSRGWWMLVTHSISIFFIQSGPPAPGMVLPTLGWGFPPQLAQCSSSLTGMRRGCNWRPCVLSGWPISVNYHHTDLYLGDRESFPNARMSFSSSARPGVPGAPLTALVFLLTLYPSRFFGIHSFQSTAFFREDSSLRSGCMSVLFMPTATIYFSMTLFLIPYFIVLRDSFGCRVGILCERWVVSRSIPFSALSSVTDCNTFSLVFRKW